MSYVLYYDNMMEAFSLDKLLKYFWNYRVKEYLTCHPCTVDQFDFDVLNPQTDNEWNSLLEYFDFHIDEVKFIE